ncbi:zinc finger MYM-type protein 1-like isoform X2 [Agrilus planipennis]|uniref:Zinc finger MYM-type protein 1-like isoform X2 n=1 Tax=Agrilus planipennis TaxID=224129 RepID=A0A7F5R8D8_AGRPL|nr:zinc finger MYM-type protein 1-like isoform X2 [Agrilus planipennis]
MLKIHENSTFHKKCYLSWIEAELRLKIGKTIDCQEQHLIRKETTRWNNVLSRLMHITLYLAENNMAFRGTSDKLYTPNNGKFLGLVQLLAKFDLVMQEHLRLAMKGDVSDHYCGKDIQNELIELMGEKVKSEIISRAKKSKYCSIIADCTSDISHVEQLSLTLRFVDLSDDNEKISVKEHFLEFIPVNESTGERLTEVIINVLNKYGLELNDCRGQGYDNGANMKGKNIGVQRRILDINPLAVYIPCGCHSYNLVLCDAAKSSVVSVTLFGVLQRLFTLFSDSVHRWKILTDHLGLYTIKKLSDTRWEARISSVKAVRYQISAIHDALITLAIETQKTDVQVSHEATTLVEQLKDFSFIVSLVVWYDILFQINIVSKSLQSTDMDLGKCTEMLKKCCHFLEDYRNTGFKSAILTAKELTAELEIEPVFQARRRIRHVKRQVGEIARDDPITSPEKKFEVEFFNCLLDTTINSVNERFEQLNEYSKSWSFLYNIKQIPEKPDLVKLCSDLQLKLTVDSRSDIDGCMLCDELIATYKNCIQMYG